MISPDQAQGWLDELVEDLGDIRYVRDEVRVPLETIAAMTVQEDWRLVDPFTNGGAYEKRRYTRMVSEWHPDPPTTTNQAPPHKGGASFMKEDE